MPDDKNAQTDDNNPDDPKDLRAKLEAALRENSELKTTVSTFTQDKQLREAGFGHLSERQRGVVLGELAKEGKELTADNAKAIAGELGFPAESPTTTTPTPGVATSPAPVNRTGDGQGNGDAPSVDASLGAFSAMERANQAALAGRVDADVQTKMKEAKSPEELRSIIRQEGPGSGIVHSWDVQ